MDWPVGMHPGVDRAGSDHEASRIEPRRGGWSSRRHLAPRGADLSSADQDVGDAVKLEGGTEDAAAGDKERFMPGRR